MEYFIDKKQTAMVLTEVKRRYKNEHDEFHNFWFRSLDADPKNDDFYTFLKKILSIDIQSRPVKLSKYDVLRVFDELEIKFSNVKLKEKFKNDPNGLIRFLEKEIVTLPKIGNKITYLVIKNLINFGDTEKYFGFSKEDLLPLLKAPVDVHIKNLLCYRLKLIPEEYYDKDWHSEGFQLELREICQESKELNPIDLDILWYVGYQNCNRKIFCNNCKIKEYCKDPYFETETRKKLKDKNRADKEIEFVKKHKEIIF